MHIIKLPHMKKPCQNCPFLKNTLKGWLGKDRMIEIINCNSFVCHKTPSMQCAGFMILLGMQSSFVTLAYRMGIKLPLKGRGLVFDSVEDCINHHSKRESNKCCY